VATPFKNAQLNRDMKTVQYKEDFRPAFSSPLGETSAASVVRPFKAKGAAVLAPHTSSSNSNSSEKSTDLVVHNIQIVGTTFKPSALKILKG
jgi:hypothetical protein